MACKTPLWSLNTILHKPFSMTSPSKKTLISSPSKKKLMSRPVSVQLQTIKESGFGHLKMRVLDGCKIHISKHWFAYDGEGGGGTAHVKNNGHQSGVIPISFDLTTLQLPPLTSSTAKVYGFVFPPFVKVHIEPCLFQGCIHMVSGQVDLQFKGKIRFDIGGYGPPPLVLETVLSSEESEGAISGTRRRGDRIGRDGKCRLIGVATLDPVAGDAAVNSLLGLPAECVTDLRAAFSF